jgi:hypothetical protein
MLKTFVIFLFLAFTSTCFCQKSIEEYKKILDRFMSAELNPEVLKNVKCISCRAKGPTDTTRYAGGYPEDSNIVLSNLEWIGFFYNLYSKDLNFGFQFYLSFHEKSNFVGPKTMLIKTFPKCIRENSQCTLISKDSAIRIAQQNGIKYPNNVYVDLVKPKNSENFFWAIDSQDPTYVNYNIPPKEGLDHPIMPWKDANTRIINALTGQIISLKDYWPLDK